MGQPVVVDASVAIKWLRPDQSDELDVEQALALLEHIDQQQVFMLQPPHFLAEVMAVIARLAPEYADRVFNALSNLDMTLVERSDVYRCAIRLSIELQHHLFDTLYHSVALQTPGAQFVTADEAYYRKARDKGQIQLLHNYPS